MSRNKHKNHSMHIKHDTNPNTWKELIDALGEIPEIEVVSNVDNENVTAINFRVTGYQGLQFIRDSFTTGWKDETGIISWESSIWDYGYALNDDAVYIHSEFKVIEGKIDAALKNIYIFFSLRDIMRVAKRMFGLFKDIVD